MSTTATTTNTHFEAARLLVKLMDQGLTFAEVTEKIECKPFAEDIAAMADTFRSDNLRSNFLAWIGA